jgi:hypothetical protein
MKTKILVLTTVAAILIAGCGAYYYYCVQKVTDYYTIMFTPFNIPLAKVFGNNSKLAKAELRITKEKDEFENDEAALEWVKSFAEVWKEDCLREAETSKDRRMILEKDATAQFMLMSFTHTRNINIDDFKEEMSKRRSLLDFQDFCEKNGINAKFYIIDQD